MSRKNLYLVGIPPQVDRRAIEDIFPHYSVNFSFPLTEPEWYLLQEEIIRNHAGIQAIVTATGTFQQAEKSWMCEAGHEHGYHSIAVGPRVYKLAEPLRIPTAVVLREKEKDCWVNETQSLLLSTKPTFPVSEDSNVDPVEQITHEEYDRARGTYV